MSSGGPDGKKLHDFFVLLAEDPALYQRYLQNPQQVMREQKLPDPVIAAVMQGNLKELNKLLKGSGKDIICGTIVRG
jgi:hypothetical protein